MAESGRLRLRERAGCSGHGTTGSGGMSLTAERSAQATLIGRRPTARDKWQREQVWAKECGSEQGNREGDRHSHGHLDRLRYRNDQNQAKGQQDEHHSHPADDRAP